MAEIILKPCPFCGKKSKINDKRLSQMFVKSFKAIEDAESFLETEREKWGELKETGIDFMKSSGKYRAHYKRAVYVPMCSIPSCLGRNMKAYDKMDEAVEAWNTRASDRR